jgi:hypothetical protein
MKKTLTICFAVLIVVSCTVKKEDVKVIEVNKSTKVLNAQALIHSGRFIKLETTNKSVIGEIIEIKLYKKLLYILEQTGSLSRILVFDLSGNFKYELGSYGRGPEEIQNPRSFCFKDSSVFIWDKNIHQLSLNNQYIQKLFECFVGGTILDIWDNQFIIFHGASKNAFVSLYDFQGNLKNKLKVSDINYEIGPAEEDAIITTGESIAFYSPMLDVIYTIKENKLVPLYKFRYNNMQSISQVLPKEEVNPYELLKLLNSSSYCRNNKYFENNDLIFFTSDYNQKNISTLLLKDRWESISFASMYNKNIKIDLTPDFMLDDKTFCKVFNIYELSKNKKINLRANNQLRSFVENSNIDDNPILFIYNFKKNK